jgi:hypothetical protein
VADDGAIYVHPPCRVEGTQLTRSRLRQLLHALRGRHHRNVL